MKIAVCISGLIRFWKVTESLFPRWNDFYDDVEFDFYLSTWKDGVYVRPDKDFGVDKNIDYEKCPFLTDYELIDSKILEFGKYLSGEYFVKSINGVFDLLKRQNKQYDLVVWTRNDAAYSKAFLDNLVKMNKKYIAPNIISNYDGMSKPDGSYWSLKDYYFIGHQDTMNVFCDIHRQFLNWKDKSILPDPPYFLGEFFIQNKIYLNRLGYICSLLKSENEFELKPHKRNQQASYSGEKLINLIENRGVDFVIENFKTAKDLKGFGI